MSHLKIKTQQSIFLILILIFFACEEEGTGLFTPSPSEESQITITTTVKGHVLDELNQAIEGAIVTYKSGEQLKTSTTDENGAFHFSNVHNKGKSAFLTIQKVGKFEAFRRLSVLENKVSFTKIRMFDKQIIGQINSNSGGTVNHSSGAKISLPPSSVVDVNGSFYTGIIDIAMTWIAPNVDELPQQIVGDLSGKNNAQEIVSLGTFGILQIELLDSNGNQLNLAEDIESTLVFPVPTSLQNIATNTIPLWSYDEEQGMWLQEGEAIYSNGTYTGNISHISNWNISRATIPKELIGNVSIDFGTTIIQPSHLAIYASTQQFGLNGGWLNEDGSFFFYNFPKNEIFDLRIVDECGSTIYQQTYGANNTDLGNIVIDSNYTNIITINGNTVDCDDNSVNNGFVTITFPNKTYTFPLEEDGSFNFNLELCENSMPELTVTNLDNQLTSNPVTISSTKPNIELGQVIICEVLTNYISMTLKGDFPEIEGDFNIIYQKDVLFKKRQDHNRISYLSFTNPIIDAFTIFFPKDIQENTDYPIDRIDYVRSSQSTTDVRFTLNLAEDDSMNIRFSTYDLTTTGGEVEGTFSGVATCSYSHKKVQIFGKFYISID